MNKSASARVLHLVPPNGGGVDRFVRDLAAQRPADWLLHVSDDQCVVEAPRSALMAPIAFDALGELAASGALGRAAALHAHSTVPAVRTATRILAQAMELAYVVTLHDIEFAGRSDVDPTERAQRLDFIRGAAHCTVPSGFMRTLALEVLGEGFACVVIENATERKSPVAAPPEAQRFPVAVVGAMGKHKGLDPLVEVAGKLPPAEGIVLLGYADGQLGPGWLADGKVWVHGAFEPEQLPELVKRYGARLAFFPKGQPESYCYALSDAWLAGLPVLAPDSGAIGERVRAHGGGTLYSPDATAGEIALTLSRLLREPAAGVEQAVRSLTPVAAMVETLNGIYAGIAAPEQAADPQALQQSTAIHLDSRFFRRELLRLQGDLASTGAQRDNALRELESLAENFRKRGEWIEQLERTGENLQRELRDLHQSTAALKLQVEEMQALPAAMQALRDDHAALQASYTDLKASYARVVRPLTWPLRLLPAAARARVIRLARRIFIEGRHG